LALGRIEGKDLDVSDRMEQRLIALESRLSHYERMVEEMSEVVAGQARTIDILTARIGQLKERVGDMAAGWLRSPLDDKPPPHY